MRKRSIHCLLYIFLLFSAGNSCFGSEAEAGNKTAKSVKTEQKADGNSALKLIKSEPLSIDNEELGFWPDGTVFNKRGARKDIEERIKAKKVAKYGARKAIKRYGEKEMVQVDLKTTFWSEVSPDGKFMMVRQSSKFDEVVDADSVFMTIEGKELWRGAWTPYYLMPGGFSVMFGGDEGWDLLSLNNRDGRVIFDGPLSRAIVKASDNSEYIAVCGNSSGKNELIYLDKGGNILWKKEYKEDIKALGVSPNGEWISIYIEQLDPYNLSFSADSERKILLLNKNAELIWEIPKAEIYTSLIYFTADSKRVVIGTFGARKVYDVLTGKYLFSFAEDSEGIQQKDYVIYTYQGILYITNTKGDVLIKKEFKETARDKDTLEKRVKENPGMRELYEIFAKKTVKKVYLDKINHNKLSVAVSDEVFYYDISGIENAVPVKTQKQVFEEWEEKNNDSYEKSADSHRNRVELFKFQIFKCKEDPDSPADYLPGYTLGEALEREEKEIAEIENKYWIILNNISILKDRYEGKFVPGRRIDKETDYNEVDAVLCK